MNFLIEFIIDGLITGSAETASNTDESKTKRLVASILLLCVFALIAAFFVFVVVMVAKKYLLLSIVLASVFGLGVVWYVFSFIKTLHSKIKS